jgi:hypothetical protein
MVHLRRSEMRVLDDAFDMGNSYVLNFSDRTMAEFFEDEFGIEIFQEKYRFNGSSKAKHLRAFFETEDAYSVSRVARALWKHRETLPQYHAHPDVQSHKERLFELLSRLEGDGAFARTDAIERFKRDETLEELIAAIERDIQANKPAAAMDRLHTYCMKKFAHLLDERGLPWDRSDPLHSRVGKYVKVLEQERELREITRKVVKSAISIFDSFNDVRNNKSFAHDNDLVDQFEARFIFDAISAFLRFLKSTEGAHFGA